MWEAESRVNALTRFASSKKKSARQPSPITPEELARLKKRQKQIEKKIADDTASITELDDYDAIDDAITEADEDIARAPTVSSRKQRARIALTAGTGLAAAAGAATVGIAGLKTLEQIELNKISEQLAREQTSAIDLTEYTNVPPQRILEVTSTELRDAGIGTGEFALSMVFDSIVSWLVYTQLHLAALPFYLGQLTTAVFAIAAWMPIQKSMDGMKDHFEADAVERFQNADLNLSRLAVAFRDVFADAGDRLGMHTAKEVAPLYFMSGEIAIEDGSSVTNDALKKVVIHPADPELPDIVLGDNLYSVPGEVTRLIEKFNHASSQLTEDDFSIGVKWWDGLMAGYGGERDIETVANSLTDIIIDLRDQNEHHIDATPVEERAQEILDEMSLWDRFQMLLA